MSTEGTISLFHRCIRQLIDEKRRDLEITAEILADNDQLTKTAFRLILTAAKRDCAGRFQLSMNTSSALYYLSQRHSIDTAVGDMIEGFSEEVLTLAATRGASLYQFVDIPMLFDKVIEKAPGWGAGRVASESSVLDLMSILKEIPAHFLRTRIGYIEAVEKSFAGPGTEDVEDFRTPCPDEKIRNLSELSEDIIERSISLYLRIGEFMDYLSQVLFDDSYLNSEELIDVFPRR